MEFAHGLKSANTTIFWIQYLLRYQCTCIPWLTTKGRAIHMCRYFSHLTLFSWKSACWQSFIILNIKFIIVYNIVKYSINQVADPDFQIRGGGPPLDSPLQPTRNLIPQFQDVCLFLYWVGYWKKLTQGSCYLSCTKYSTCTTPRDWEPCHKWSAIYGEYSHHFHKLKHSGHHWTHCGSWHVLLGHAVSQGHHIQFHPMTPISLDLMLVKSANWCELLSEKKIKLLSWHTHSHLSSCLSLSMQEN